MISLGGDARTQRDDNAPVFIPLVERPIAAPHCGLTDRHRNEDFRIAPDDPHTVSTRLERWNLTDVNRQTHTRLTDRPPGDSAIVDATLPEHELATCINSPSAPCAETKGIGTANMPDPRTFERAT